MMRIVIIIFIIVFIKIILNASKLLQTKYYLKLYNNYLRADENANNWHFAESHSSILSLLRNAKIDDVHLPYVEEVARGLGSVYTRKGTFSVFNNLFTKREDAVQIVMELFYRAIGYYKSRIVESINPLYWLDVIIFLPKHLLEYFDIELDSLKKIMQVIYWVVWIILYIFQEEIVNAIRAYL